MIEVYVLSPVDEIWQRILTLNMQPIINCHRYDHATMRITEIDCAGHLSPILLIDDSAMNQEDLLTFLHHIRATNTYLRVGFITSYGRESEARKLHHAHLIHFYLQRRFNNSLLIAEFFAATHEQVSFSVCLQEILELALDNNCSPVAEKIAEIKQQLACK